MPLVAERLLQRIAHVEVESSSQEMIDVHRARVDGTDVFEYVDALQTVCDAILHQISEVMIDDFREVHQISGGSS